ncbi:MAG: PTS sugar transporter subunit IIA [Candidatus Omnitrophica bacterium]|nr:PTS sugar transporter subunit IIA [Candidatus Omnitrophota bacterium]
MKLSSVVNKKLIFPDLKATTMEGIVDEMMGNFVEEMGIDKSLKDTFVAAIMERERQASTAFGKGVAFPHARVDRYNDFAIMIGIQRSGIEHKALDKKPVRLFFMIVTAKTKNTQLLRALASLAELTSHEGVIEKIIASTDTDSIFRIIDGSNVAFKKSITAEDVMITEPFFVTPEMTMKEAADVLFNKNIAGLPVVENGKIVGELTEKELIRVGLPESLSFLGSVSFLKDFEAFEKFFKEEDKLQVKDICNRNVQTVLPDASIVEVAFIFVHKNRRRVYVTDKDQKLLGIVMRHHVLMKILHP